MVVKAAYRKAKRPTRSLEQMLLESGVRYIAGVDEVGRGAWAGPMYAAAVIIDVTRQYPMIRDSKSLSRDQRERGAALITSKSLGSGIGSVSPEEIDTLGLTKATERAMQRAITTLMEVTSIRPDHILVDAFSFHAPGDIPVEPIVHGDRDCLSIAAASVIAKVARDAYMVSFHEEDDRYGFDQHKGYGTALHQERLRIHGLSMYHRRSFVPAALASVPS